MYNKFKTLNYRTMNQIIIIVLALIGLDLSAQEGPGGRPDQNTVSTFNNSCIVVLNIGNPSCNNIKFCYDESGNRIVRYRQLCSSPWIGNSGGSGTMMTKAIQDTQGRLAMLEATTIYPNPTEGITNIEFNEEIENAKVEVFDMSGRSISSHVFTGKKTRVDLSQQAAGTYYIVISRNKQKVAKPVIKE